MNPHGVGYSGGRTVHAAVVCDCCQVEFEWVGPPEQRGLSHSCRYCECHSTSTMDAELAMLREHNQRLPRLVAKAREMTRNAMDYVRRRDRLDDERKEQVPVT